MDSVLALAPRSPCLTEWRKSTDMNFNFDHQGIKSACNCKNTLHLITALTAWQRCFITRFRKLLFLPVRRSQEKHKARFSAALLQQRVDVHRYNNIVGSNGSWIGSFVADSIFKVKGFLFAPRL